MTPFIHPKYWFSWIGVGFLWLMSQLPWRWQMKLGGAIGKALYHLIPKRRRVCLINLRIAFPQKTDQEVEIIAKDHFASLGKGMFDSTFSWWGDNKKLKKLSHIDGFDHLRFAQNTKQPIILLGSHFTSMEVIGNILSQHIKHCFVYRPHQNKLLDHISIKQREERYGKAIPKHDIKGMIKMLKQGKAVWYAPDQQFHGRNHLMVPFFGVEAPTNPGTSRLARLSNAVVLPIFCTREEQVRNKLGYTLHIMAPLNNFPSDNLYNDTLVINKIFEEQILNHTEQYLWTHKRYKGCSINGENIYK